MSFSFTAMIRLMGLLAVGSTLLAIGVSRLDPPQPIRRFHRPVTNHNINDYFLQTEDRKSHWIDSTTGGMTDLPVVGDDVFEAASCSPWVDDSGRRQAVGRWANRTFLGPLTISHAFGLARYSFPDGRMLNQIATDVVPTGPPCWFPGTQARVVFAAGDGRLYRFGFEPAVPTGATSESGQAVDPQPSALDWGCPKPGGGEVFIGDLAWPDAPQLGGRLVAALWITDHDMAGKVQFSRTQLWWLKLNHSATEIIAAGPLVNHDVSGPLAKQFDERSPTVSALPDGSLALAYTRHAAGKPGWSAHLAPLTITADHDLVPTLESRTRVAAAHCRSAPVAFSTDGRWLNVLVGETNSAESSQRVRTLPPATPTTVASAQSR